MKLSRSTLPDIDQEREIIVFFRQACRDSRHPLAADLSWKRVQAGEPMSFLPGTDLEARATFAGPKVDLNENDFRDS